MRITYVFFIFAIEAIPRALSKLNAPREELFTSDGMTIKRNLDDVYQLKMYWRNGMEWQGYSREFAWCAECHSNDCDYGDVVVIKECNDDKSDQKWIFEDDKIKPLKNPDLCITARDDLEGYVNLRTCYDKRDKYQKFNLYDDDDDKFQVQPRADNDLCLTQNVSLIRFIIYSDRRN